MDILAKLEKLNKVALVVASFLFIGVLGLIDYLTGYEIAFSVFYVLPISLVTWVSNRRLGLAASFISAVAWLAADVLSAQQYSSPFIPFWNSLMRLSFFVIITFLLSSLKKSLELAHTDHLTSAINSRHFYAILQIEFNRFRRTQRPFTLAYIDLDNFKSVNDLFGHTTGDQVLHTLVNSIQILIRRSDFIARLGGDEFAVLFPETDQEAAQIIVAKIQSAFAEAMQQKQWPVTFSVGVVTCKSVPNTTDELVKIADNLMYLAKSEGKNRVRYFTFGTTLTVEQPQENKI